MRAGLLSTMTRRLTAGLALAALGVALAGCGLSESVDPVASAATKSADAGGARITFSATISSPSLPGGRELTMSGSGVVSNGQAELTLDLSQLLQQTGAPAGTDGTAKELFLREGGDYVIYMQLGLLGQLPGGKHWMKIDFSRVGQKSGIDFNKLMGNQTAADPAQMLAMLRASSGKVDNLGNETVDGAVTTHYRATVDLAKAAKLQGVPSGVVDQLTGGSGFSQIPVDVWVGQDALVRKLQLALDMTTSNVPVSMTMTMGFSDYGTQAAVVAPPAEDVFDVTDLAARGVTQ